MSRLLSLVLALVLFPLSPALAQSNAEVRNVWAEDAAGWRVISYELDGAFVGCRALQRIEGSGRMQISLEKGDWVLSVPNRKFAKGGDTAVIGIDGVEFRTEVVFVRNWARAVLAPDVFEALRGGAELSVTIPRIVPRRWPLDGLPEALGEVEACVAVFGE